MRTVLTTLGVLIGVAAVIVVVAVGNGASASVQQRISGLGTTTITVRSGGATFGQGAASSASLTVADADALVGPESPDVASAVPVVSTSATVSSGGTSTTTQVVGTRPGYLDASSYGVSAGEPFTTADVDAARKVVLLGSSVATDVFAGASPVGRQVLLDGVPFTVVGVVASEGTSSGGGADADAVVIAPLTTLQRSLTGFGSISSITVQARSAEVADGAAAQVSAVLADRHPAADGQEAGFTVTSASALLSTAQETTRTFTVLLGAIAAISLLVGGVGVTNIMLVSVTERTREIGVRKALGATPAAVLGQFLLEAVLLSLLGGGLGVALGLALSRLEISGIQPVVVPASVVVALGVCVAIGLFFGGYPAHRAARLRPVDALRHE
ncbi:ABC transporter permease [Kineococcus glutinatus]